jgi:hypothetical protein
VLPLAIISLLHLTASAAWAGQGPACDMGGTMIFLYSVLLLLLGGVKFIVQRRATALGRAYSKLAETVQKRLRETVYKQGNSSKPDVCQIAKIQFELGALVARRDRVEAKHFVWQHAADTLSRWVNALATWKGKKLPYTLGAVDIWLLLSAIDTLGVGEFVSASRLYQMVVAMLTS